MIEFINAHHGKTLCQTFTDLAARTWEYLDLGSKFGLLPGEETLTDENLMAIYALHYSHVAIKKFSRYRESELGADWEWWFGNQTDGWFGMRVQAKKIDIQTYSLYPELKRPHNEERQISDLISGCTNTQIFPAYCFYNTRIESKNPEWGCSITPAQAVMNIFDQGTSGLSKLKFRSGTELAT